MGGSLRTLESTLGSQAQHRTENWLLNLVLIFCPCFSVFPLPSTNSSSSNNSNSKSSNNSNNSNNSNISSSNNNNNFYNNNIFK